MLSIEGFGFRIGTIDGNLESASMYVITLRTWHPTVGRAWDLASSVTQSTEN